MIALDCETNGLELRYEARPFFVTIARENGTNDFYQWNVDPHTRKPEIPRADLVEIRQSIIESDKVVFHNGKFDIAALDSIGIKWAWWDKVEDTILSAHLLGSNDFLDLTTQALLYLSTGIQRYEDTVDKAVKEARREAKKKYPNWKLAVKKSDEIPSSYGTQFKAHKYDMWLPRAFALAEKYEPSHPWWTVLQDYANVDSTITLNLYKVHKKLLEDQGLYRIYQERLKLLPIVYKMESTGITDNVDRLEESYTEYADKVEECRAVCSNLADGQITELPLGGSSNALKAVIYDRFKLKSNKVTKKGNDSMDKHVLEYWLDTVPERTRPHVFIRNLIDYRQCRTAIGFMESYKRFGLPTKFLRFSRLYPSLNPTGTSTLRFSSSNPNAQQTSKREGSNLRYIFGPLPGREWWSLDYENIELRIPAYESGERAMIDVFEKPDDPPYFGSYHLLNASIIYPDLFWPLAEKKGEFKKQYASTWYQWVKNFGFAVGYGAIESSGTADRAAHKPGAQRMVMDQLKEHTKLNQRMVDYANRHGYVETIPDTEVDPSRGYPLVCERTRWGSISPTIPLNYHVQGTACWVMMRAMMKVSEYLKTLDSANLIMQIHDELLIDMPFVPDMGNLSRVKKVRDIMTLLGDCIGIPLTCGITYHPDNWSVGQTV